MDSSVIFAPLIMRAISFNLSSPVISRTFVMVVLPSDVFSILKCLSANPATWAEWVITKAWDPCARRFNRSPTALAVAPLIPVSTSSKINVCAAFSRQAPRAKPTLNATIRPQTRFYVTVQKVFLDLFLS